MDHKMILDKRKKMVNWECQVFHSNNKVIVLRPLKCNERRIFTIWFENADAASKWIAGGGTNEDLVMKKLFTPKSLPVPKIQVRRRKKSFVVGPMSKVVSGLTKPLSVLFGDLSMKLPQQKGLNYVDGSLGFSPKRKPAKHMQSIGIAVDKELKHFAQGRLSYNGIKRQETRVIVTHLSKKGISLIGAGVLVTNYSEYKKSKRFSGTEIDLVGFDHIKQSYVIIEVKVTGTGLSYLKEYDRQAVPSVICGFRRSVLGKYKAQLACTTLMYGNTYGGSTKCYPLLVICESRDGHCESFGLKESDLQQTNLTSIKEFEPDTVK